MQDGPSSCHMVIKVNSVHINITIGKVLGSNICKFNFLILNMA